MALVSQGWFVTFSFVDNGNNVVTRRYKSRKAAFADVQTDVAAAIPLIQAVTDAVISGYLICEQFAEDNLTFPAAGIENENQALINVQLAGGVKKATLNIPAPKIDIFQSVAGPGANIVDIVDSDVINFFQMFSNTGSATPPDDAFFISDGEIADILLKGKRISRKSLRG